MPKDISTPTQSAVGGFTFADKAFASCLLKMLVGRRPLDAASGQIEPVVALFDETSVEFVQ